MDQVRCIRTATRRERGMRRKLVTGWNEEEKDVKLARDGGWKL
jgi:hypothetical protein